MTAIWKTPTRFFSDALVSPNYSTRVLIRWVDFGNSWNSERLHWDSARQISLGSTSHEISNCSGDVPTGGQKELAEFFMLAEFETFLLVAPEPAVLWTNRGHSDTQCIERVQKYPSTEF